MKKHAKPTKTPRHARTAALTEQELAAVVAGTDGTIIVENVVARPRGLEPWE